MCFFNKSHNYSNIICTLICIKCMFGVKTHHSDSKLLGEQFSLPYINIPLFQTLLLLKLSFYFFQIHKTTQTVKIRGLFKKYLTIARGRRNKCMLVSCVQTLISFKVGPFLLHTLNPAVLPLLETFLKVLFWYGYQLCCRFVHYVLSALKLGPFQWHQQVGEQPKVRRSHGWRVRSPTNLGNSVLGQEILDQTWRMGRGVCCCDAAAICVTPTGPVPCTELHHKDDEEPLDNTVC